MPRLKRFRSDICSSTCRIQGFPTIKAYVNGRMIDYTGDRSAGHLKDWAISLIPQKVSLPTSVRLLHAAACCRISSLPVPIAGSAAPDCIRGLTHPVERRDKPESMPGRPSQGQGHEAPTCVLCERCPFCHKRLLTSGPNACRWL